MRNMSFMLTTDAMRRRLKMVTRRIGWDFLKVGDVVMAVEKCQGLKKGETVKKLYPIRILDIRRENLFRITPSDVVLEGFPNMNVRDFIEMFCASHKGCHASTIVNRIEFREEWV